MRRLDRIRRDVVARVVAAEDRRDEGALHAAGVDALQQSHIARNLSDMGGARRRLIVERLFDLFTRGT